MDLTVDGDQADQSAADDYFEDGRRRAMQLGNRGPVRLDQNGKLAQDILDAYHRIGFYVFTDVLAPAEVAELAAEFDQVLETAPVAKGHRVDKYGRESEFAAYFSLKPPPNDPDGPISVGMLSHPLMIMNSALRVYGHPQILQVAEGVHGPDFVPFHESIFHKAAGDGLPTSWHQDGRVHWTPEGESVEANGAGPSNGFNLSVSWTNCTPQNCLWVVPGSHSRWLLANGGKFPPISERVPGAVPMLLDPGDCGMVNRNTLHGSYPNQSSERRVTMVVGFHKRSSTIGAEVLNVHADINPPDATGQRVKYSEEYVLRRARMIPLAIDARRQYYPDETPYTYSASYLGEGAWNERTRAEIKQIGAEYWQQDITL